MKRTVVYIFSVAFIIWIGTLTTGCANIVPPEGGPRDTLPPMILEVTPGDSSVNFSGNRVSFTFNEFVKVENAFQNVLISPIPRNIPSVTSRLNTITVRFRDSLDANTTYSINFGDAIVDVNENNPLHNYTYIFSTGPALDSFTFSGKVLMAETGEVDSTLIVILHTSPRDSVLITDKPRYMTKLDRSGNFNFRNLPSDSFYAYALKDDSRTYRYLNKTVPFAFEDSVVIVNDSTRRVTLYAYSETKPASTSTTEGGTTADKRLRFTSSADPDGTHDLLKPFQFNFLVPLREFDTTRIRFATDTLFTTITNYSWTLDTTQKKATLNYTWNEGTLYHLILEKEFATDTLGQQLLKADTLTFKTRTSKDYGSLTLRFRNLDLSVNPVLQFVQTGEVVNSYPLTDTTFISNLFKPGEYQLRILHDRNKNGVWDPGEFYGKRLQPEFVRPIEKSINVRTDFQNQFEIVL